MSDGNQHFIVNGTDGTEPTQQDTTIELHAKTRSQENGTVTPDCIQPEADQFDAHVSSTLTSGSLAPCATEDAQDWEENQPHTKEEAWDPRSAPSNADTISAVDQPVNANMPHSEKAVHGWDHSSHIPVLTFRRGHRKRYAPMPEQKLRNNLSGMVGYLEFANALDFAANVWNTIPVPTFAAVLMGLGGGTALILALFALLDGLKCWKNVVVLRKERANLRAAMHDREKAELIDGRDLDVKVEVNRRELGQEIVDRFLMDIFMGFSSLVVGVGTILAIAGANPRIYHASNLLSGYIGNSPSAFWGLGNTLWSAYLFRRASRHVVTGTRVLQDEVVTTRLSKRTRSVQLHAFIMGLATLVSAPCGLVTATMWQGYPPLIPCIVLAKLGNTLWKRRLGYSRFPISVGSPPVEPADLIEELRWTINLQTELSKDKKAASKDYIQSYRGAGTTTAFMSRLGLLEDLGLELINRGYIKHGDQHTIELDQTLFEKCEKQEPKFAQTASSVFQRKGYRALAYRERYLLELLGASLVDAGIVRRQSMSRLPTRHG